MFSDNTQYKLKKSLIVSKDILGVVNKISDGSYTVRELKSFIAGIISPVKYAERVEKTNNLLNITELNLDLNELDNTDNLGDGRLSNTLLTYHVTDYDDFTNYQPKHLQYKKLKSGRINSLTVEIKDQNDEAVNDSLKISIILHVREV